MDTPAHRLAGIAKDLLDGRDLDAILRRVLEAARDLTGAQYAAVGVLNERRDGLARFVTAGIDKATAEGLGDPPRGRGVLGELISNPRPLRLEAVGEHVRSYGFPAGHPPMKTFLGTPILIDDVAYGNLYLTEKPAGALFTGEDEDLVVLLSEYAALAIKQAERLTELSSGRRELEQTVAVLSATNEITRALAGETELDAVLELVAKRGRALISATTVVVLLLEGSRLKVAKVVGEAPRGVLGRSYGRKGSVADEVLKNQRPRAINSQRDHAVLKGLKIRELGFDPGSALFVPLTFRNHNMGVLVAMDRYGPDQDFEREHEELLWSFATSAAAVVATAQMTTAQRLREREMAAEAERRRWARELHDETLQNLAALQMTLLRSAGRPDTSFQEAAEDAARLLQLEIDRLRDIIEDVRPSSLDDLGLMAALEALVERQRSPLGPSIELVGELAYDTQEAGTRLEAEVETAIYRIAQEAITNALKHAEAKTIQVAVAELDNEIGVRVRDDGVGFDASASRAGLGLIGIRERVAMFPGRLNVKSAPGEGTTLEARIPFQRRSAPVTADRGQDAVR